MNNSIPEYINDWFKIIDEMNNDNTYKLAWGRAILECVDEEKYSENFLNHDEVIITFNDIAEFMIKYYWNQIFFFNLKQSIYSNKEPIICTLVKNFIIEYKNIVQNDIPVWFDIGLKTFKTNKKTELYDDLVSKVARVLNKDVSYRFLNVCNGVLPVYRYSKDDDSKIYIDIKNVELLKTYNVILCEILNYKWSQLLEKYNYQPKITQKVKGISENQLRRNSLNKFKNILLSYFKDGKIKDFYSNDYLSEDNISIDHVIPWSFIYSDDIWNLVFTSKSNNSHKSNSIPTEDVIKKLKERNIELYKITSDIKAKEDLKYAIDNNLVDKFYHDLRM